MYLCSFEKISYLYHNANYTDSSLLKGSLINTIWGCLNRPHHHLSQQIQAEPILLFLSFCLVRQELINNLARDKMDRTTEFRAFTDCKSKMSAQN